MDATLASLEVTARDAVLPGANAVDVGKPASGGTPDVETGVL